MNELLQIAITAALEAGDKILEVYNSDFAVEHKDDNSPLTLADKKSHDCITAHLAETPYPLLSEEGAEIPYEERKNWKTLWIVDPLDGTKEFVKRNGEFTVNIALVENGIPVLGVIFVPVQQKLYYAAKGMGAFTLSTFGLQPSTVDLGLLMNTGVPLPVKHNRNKFTIVASRSHLSEETLQYVEDMKKKHGEVDFISSGSSLKICLVAEGSADVYPRFAPTMEWDTAAGQAIALEAGKNLIDFSTGNPMVYNREQLRNNWFIAE
ncbi:MAG: 3'(2'),5'-bisphosphate nucleotidase CysQ [Bacteroidota bacterium]